MSTCWEMFFGCAPIFISLAKMCHQLLAGIKLKCLTQMPSRQARTFWKGDRIKPRSVMFTGSCFLKNKVLCVWYRALILE